MTSRVINLINYNLNNYFKEKMLTFPHRSCESTRWRYSTSKVVLNQNKNMLHSFVLHHMPFKREMLMFCPIF